MADSHSKRRRAYYAKEQTIQKSIETKRSGRGWPVANGHAAPTPQNQVHGASEVAKPNETETLSADGWWPGSICSTGIGL